MLGMSTSMLYENLMIGKYMRLQVQTSLLVSSSISGIKTLPLFEASVLLSRILKSSFRDSFLPISGLHTISFALAVHLGKTSAAKNKMQDPINHLINGLKSYKRSTSDKQMTREGVNQLEEGFYLRDNHLREPGRLILGP